MRRWKYLSWFFAVLGVILSDVMCAYVAYTWCDIWWRIKYVPFSVDEKVALLLAIPYLVGIVVCVIFAWFCNRRYHKLYDLWRKSGKVG